ncbi:LCP family protein [Actinomycetes bacterium KLBMP 9759]
MRDTPPPVRRVRAAESAPEPMTQALPTNGVNGSARRRAAEPPPTTGERPRVRRGDRDSGTHAIPPGERSAQRARRSDAEGVTRATPVEGRPRERRRDRDSGTHAIPPGERSAPRVRRVEPEGATRAIPTGERPRTRRADPDSGAHAVPPRARRRDTDSGAHPVPPGEAAGPRTRRGEPDDDGSTRAIPANGRPRSRRTDPESGSHAVPPRARRREADSGAHPVPPPRRRTEVPDDAGTTRAIPAGERPRSRRGDADSGAHVVPPGERSSPRVRRPEPADGESGARRIPAGERSGSRTRRAPRDTQKPVPDGVRAAAFGAGAGPRAARGDVEPDSTQAIPQGGRPPQRPPRNAPPPVDDDFADDFADDPDFGAGVTRALPTGPPRRPPRDERGLDEFAPSGLPERQRRGDPIDPRAARIDETLTRLTAAHAGMAIARDDDPDDAPQKPAKRARFTPGRILGLGVAALVFGTTALGFTSKTLLDSAVLEVAALDKKAASIVDAPAQAGDQNVLIMATTGNAQPSASDLAASSVAVAHFPADGGEVRVISLPWNLEINRPPCEPFDPKTGTYGGQPVQIEANANLASAYQKGGPKCTAQVVQGLTGLAITSFVGMDLEKMKAAVDAVGGVEVCVPHPVRDTALGPILPNAGDQNIDSKRAGDLMRAVDVEGDPASGRGIIERQQAVLAGVLDSTVSTTGLLSVRRVSALRTALGGALMADGSDIDQMLALSRTLSRLDADGVVYLPVPTTTQPNQRGHVEMRLTEASAIFAAMRTDAPLPEGAVGAGSSGSGLAPKDLSIRVFNASDRSGLAGTVGETLKGLGFGVSEVKNADKPTQKTVIKFSPDKQAAAELLAASVPSAETVPDPGTNGVLDLVLGRSFDDAVKPPVGPSPSTQDPAAPAAGGATCG